MAAVATWQRWVKYGKAKLDATLAAGNKELDEREAELAAEAEGKPWLRSSGESPTIAEVKARIEHEAGAEPPPAATDRPADEAFALAEQQRAADERLADIRRELGLDDEPPAAEPPVDPPPTS